MLAGAIGSSGLADRGTLALIAFGIFAFVGASWWVSLKRWPYTRLCWRCGGTGLKGGSNRRRHDKCPRCKGKDRLRRGAKLVHGDRRS